MICALKPFCSVHIAFCASHSQLNANIKHYFLLYYMKYWAHTTYCGSRLVHALVLGGRSCVEKTSVEPHSSWSLSSSRPSHCQRPTTRRRRSTSRDRCVVPAASAAAAPPPPPNCCRPAPSVVDGPRHAADLQVRIPCQHSRVSILTVYAEYH